MSAFPMLRFLIAMLRLETIVNARTLIRYVHWYNVVVVVVVVIRLRND
jgi:hypothetical protein